MNDIMVISHFKNIEEKEKEKEFNSFAVLLINSLNRYNSLYENKTELKNDRKY